MRGFAFCYLEVSVTETMESALQGSMLRLMEPLTVISSRAQLARRL